MKRSRRMGLLALSTVSVLALTACKEDAAVSIEQHNAAVFSSMEACLADAKKTGASTNTPEGGSVSPMQELELACVEDWKAAQAEHEKNAPRFSSLDQCEAEFGKGNCGSPAGGTTVIRETDSSSIFLPLMMGYMLGGGFNSSPSYPVYASQYGNLRSTTPSATARLRNSSAAFVSSTGLRSKASAVRVSGGKVAPVKSVKPKATMSSSTRSRSGGFGASRSSTSSRSSFGG
ncbi:DUF1190 domain-containing protein [Halovulum marinum]|nr:DUF1190 domain-containing protein [Halovulum marinum]